MSNESQPTRDWLGSGIGLLVFLLGVGLIVIVFRSAYAMFTTPPSVALDIQPGKALDLARTSDSVTAIMIRVILLILMTALGSIVANRGIALYARSIAKPSTHH